MNVRARVSRPQGFLPLPARGILFALLATVVWSGNFILCRGLADSIPPFSLALSRWLTAFCAVLPFALPGLKADWPHLWAHRGYYLATSAVGITFFNTAIYAAGHTVAALNMSLIAASSPLFTLVFARVFLGEAVSPGRLAGIFIVLAGIVLLVARGDFSVLPQMSFQGGDLLMLAAALSFAVYTLLVRKKPAGCGQLTYLAATFGLGLFMLIPGAAWECARTGLPPATPAVIGGVLYAGLGASLFSFWCWSRAIAAIGAGRASVIYYSLPFFCGVEAVLFLGEPVAWVHYASGALILGGLLLANRG